MEVKSTGAARFFDTQDPIGAIGLLVRMGLYAGAGYAGYHLVRDRDMKSAARHMAISIVATGILATMVETIGHSIVKASYETNLRTQEEAIRRAAIG